MELTGSFIADIELLISIGIFLCLFLYLVVRLPVVGLVCFIFLTLTRAHEYIPNSELFRPSVIVGMIMLIGLAFHLLIMRQPLRFTGPQSWLLVVFIAISLILLFTKGQMIYDSNNHLLIEPLLLVAVAFFATLNAVKSLSDLKIILNTFAVIGVTIALLTLVQSFITGIMTGQTWIYMGEQGMVNRAGSLGIDPNEVAATLATLLPVFFFLFDNEKSSTFRRTLYLLGIPLAILTIFLTYSRGGFLCLMVALFLIFKKRLLAKYVIGFAALVIIIFVLVPFTFWERIASTGTTDTTGQGRMIIWEVTLNMIQEHPLTGIGFGQFPYVFAQYSGQKYYYFSPQSTYLGIAAETGIVNLLIYLVLCGVTFFNLHQLKRGAQILNDTVMIKLCDVLNASLVVAMISGLTLDRRMWILVYILLALAVVLKRIGQQSRAPVAVAAHDVRMIPRLLNA